ncbi:unnamed protein product, partial [Ixodes hexagonus]
LSPGEVCSLDKFPINPHNNTITVSTPDEDRRLAYLQIRSLVIGGKTHEVTAHMATPSDSTRIVVPKALSLDGTEDAEAILLSCIGQNPQWQVLAARRMGKSRALLVTIQARGPRHTSSLMGSLSAVSRTEIESRRASTVDERVTGSPCRRVSHATPEQVPPLRSPTPVAKRRWLALRVPAPVRHLRGQAHHGLQRMLKSLCSPP